jgi:hypothetical protein
MKLPFDLTPDYHMTGVDVFFICVKVIIVIGLSIWIGWFVL